MSLRNLLKDIDDNYIFFYFNHVIVLNSKFRLLVKDTV